jgi:hypothetical protein
MASSDDQTIDQFDRVLNVELGNRLVGVVRVDLSCLDFVKGREIDPHTVQGLTNLFESTACRRNELHRCSYYTYSSYKSPQSIVSDRKRPWPATRWSVALLNHCPKSKIALPVWPA